MKTDMKKLIFSFLTFLLVASTFAAQAGENKISRNYTVKNSFTAIKVSGNIEVDYAVASNVSISAKAVPGLLDILKIYVKDNTLYLETKGDYKPSRGEDNDIEVKLQAPLIVSYTSSGNSEIEVKSAINANTDLTFKSSGNSSIDVDMPVNGKSVAVETSGNSGVELDDGVNCKNMLLNSSGNSSMKLNGVKTTTVEAVSSGNSGIKISGNADSAKFSSSGNSQINARKLAVRNISSSNSGNASVIR